MKTPVTEAAFSQLAQKYGDVFLGDCDPMEFAEDVHSVRRKMAAIESSREELLEALEISHACGNPEVVEEGEIYEWTHPDGRTWRAPAVWNEPPPMHPAATEAIANARKEGA